MTHSNSKSAEAQMLIRKPVELVFNSFIDPEITRNFWFTRGSDKLIVGKTVLWEWEMYHISTKVFVKEIVANKKISIEWDNPATSVDFDFLPLGDKTTFVSIKHYGFAKTGYDLIDLIKDSTAGFTTVLDGCKAFLEHNINLNLIADKFPKEIGNHGH